MVGVRCCDYKRISLGEARYEDARIAGRNDHDLVSHASSIEHVCEIGWRTSSPQRLRRPRAGFQWCQWALRVSITPNPEPDGSAFDCVGCSMSREARSRELNFGGGAAASQHARLCRSSVEAKRGSNPHQ
jgi:hypothetical protein